VNDLILSKKNNQRSPANQPPFFNRIYSLFFIQTIVYR